MFIPILYLELNKITDKMIVILYIFKFSQNYLSMMIFCWILEYSNLKLSIFINKMGIEKNITQTSKGLIVEKDLESCELKLPGKRFFFRSNCTWFNM